MSFEHFSSARGKMEFKVNIKCQLEGKSVQDLAAELNGTVSACYHNANSAYNVDRDRGGFTNCTNSIDNT